MAKLIQKWKSTSKKGVVTFYVHRNTNGRIEDYNRYKSRQGRNDKVRRLKEKYPSYKVAVKDAQLSKQSKCWFEGGGFVVPVILI